MNQAHLGETHRVENVSTELVDYNLFTTDTPLVEAVAREGGAWGATQIHDFAGHIGRAEYLELGYLANRYPDAPPQDQAAFRAVLEMDDPDIYAICVKRMAPPPQLKIIFDQLQVRRPG